MLKILNEKIKRTSEDIEQEYPDSKYLLVDFQDDEDITGYLYCVSESIDSYKEICDKRREINMNGGVSVVMGNYKQGGMIGVQYEVEPK